MTDPICEHSRAQSLCLDCGLARERARVVDLMDVLLGDQYQHGVIAKLREAVLVGHDAKDLPREKKRGGSTSARRS